MSLVKEFKEFAMRGNVLDLAVGIIIGGAFGKVVASVVSDLVMPPIGLVIGGVNFTDIKIEMKPQAIDALGHVAPAVTLNIGNFIQALVDFTVIAAAVFLLVQGINVLKARMAAEEAAVAAVAPPTATELLLTEIRDLLKK